MKVAELIETEDRFHPLTGEKIKPATITYRQQGDGSWVAKAVTSSGGVQVHTRKKRSDLEKVMSRYK